MKKQSGITLLTLMIYIIGILVVTGIVAVIINFFMQNIAQMDDSTKDATEFNKFNLEFIKEVKTYGNDVTEPTEVNVESDSVSFSSGNKYTYQNNMIYKNNVAIARNVSSCEFTLKRYEAKQIVNVKIGFKNGFSRKHRLCCFL